MSVLSHPSRESVLEDAHSQLSIVSFTNTEYAKKELFQDVHILDQLCFRLVDSTTGCVMLH